MESICKPHRPYSLAASETPEPPLKLHAPLWAQILGFHNLLRPSTAPGHLSSFMSLVLQKDPEALLSSAPSASCGSRTRGEAEARLRSEPSHGLGRLTQLRGLFVPPGGGLRAGKTNRAKAQRLGGWLGAGRKCAVWLERETKPDPQPGHPAVTPDPPCWVAGLRSLFSDPVA